MAFIDQVQDLTSLTVSDNGEPYIKHIPLAFTTLESWSQKTSDTEDITYDSSLDVMGTYPTILAVESISELGKFPTEKEDGTLAQTSLVVIGDTDFASNKYAGSAMNSDLLINSINWLAKDYELITIRPKTQSFRELVLTSSERDFIRWSGWLFMPSLIGIGGIISWWRRR